MAAGGSAGDVAVLVVGAGPAGLSAAITLARYGISTVLVERRAELSKVPRATTVSTRTMELFRSWGLERQIRAGGVDVEWHQWVGETLLGPGRTEATSYPTREQSLVVSPTGPAAVPQDHIEPVLLRHLRSLPSARVRLGTELVGLDNRPDGIHALLREVRTGQTRLRKAHYAIAADGVRSRTRELLGIDLCGGAQLSSAMAVLFRAPLWGLLGGRRHFLYTVTHPDAAGVFLPAGRDDRWTYGTTFPAGRVPAAERSAQRAVERIRLAAGTDNLQPRIEQIGAFTFAAQIAERFRTAHTFLVGDAAHRVTPRGGTGMNTAIQGAHHLAWKLAWVLRGWAEPALLDSYESEFRPVAEHNVRRSADPAGGSRGVEEELPIDLGARIPHLWLTTPAGRTSTLDLLGLGLTLFTGPQGETWRAAANALPGPLPVAVHRLDAVAARALGLGSRGALLARPDAAPAGSWPCDADAARVLRTAVASLAGSSSPPRCTTTTPVRMPDCGRTCSSAPSVRATPRPARPSRPCAPSTP